jgi:hypothetical protein
LLLGAQKLLGVGIAQYNFMPSLGGYLGNAGTHCARANYTNYFFHFSVL